MRVDAVLFDWDGTLYDSVPSCFRIYKMIFKKLGINSLTYELFREEFCADYHAYYGRCGIGKEKWKEVDSIWVEEFGKIEGRIPLFPDVRETLEELREKGIKTGLVSNGSGVRIRRELRNDGISGLLDVVVTADEAPEFKPSPEGIRMALEEIGVEGKNCFYVGDLREDIRAGRAAGTVTAAVLTGVHKREKLETERPDYILDKVGEVLKLID